MASASVIFLVAVMKHLTEAAEGKNELFLAHSLGGYKPSWLGEGKAAGGGCNCGGGILLLFGQTKKQRG